MSDLLRVPNADDMLHPVPSGVDPIALASAGENITDGWRRVAPHIQNSPGAKVFAVALGAAHVDYVDTNTQRLETAETLGARSIRRERSDKAWKAIKGTSPETYDISVDAAGSATALSFALRSLAPGGV